MRRSLTAVFVYLIFLLLCSSSLLAQGPLLPTQPWFFHDPGPFATASADWNHGNVQVTNPSGGGNITVQHYGVVFYPDDGTGNILPPITSYPLIVFAHGRFQQAPYTGNNHKQATYLLQHLASWGFVVASVNLDVVGQYATPAAIPQRGELINKTVEYFQTLNPYAPYIDFTRIVYIGHSRGGEGVFAAVQQNPSFLSSIRGIAAIAPTNFQAYAIPAHAFVIYGSQDGDVNNGWPIQLYDQTNVNNLKGFRYIEGANHFYFTDSISYFAETNAILTRTQHHEIATTYFATWCAAIIFGDRPSMTRIAGDKEIQWSTNFKIHRIFNNPRRITVDNFEQVPANVTRNTIGGINTLVNLTGAAEKSLNSATASSFFHVTKGMTASWSASASFTADLQNGLDVVGYSYISCNLLQKYASASNPSGQAQRFHLSLIDLNGNSATLDNTDIAPWPYPFTTNANGPIKSVLKTFRFPLQAFTAQNSALDLTQLDKVSILFDVTATGDIALDDVAFTQ